MFEKLHIRNYRIVKDLKIDQLRRINLIAGSNNSGKTSLLEAIFLLAGSGNAHMAMNFNVVRAENATGARPIRDVFWKPMFSDLDLSKSIEISGCHSSLGQLNLAIASERLQNTEPSLEFANGTAASATLDELSLRFEYSGPTGKLVTSRIFVDGAETKLVQPEFQIPVGAMILLSRTVDGREDAIRLAKLKQQKRDQFVLEALKVVEPKLQSIVDNSASGVPMIWGDVGLSELIPLATLGEGMTRLARLVLAIYSMPEGVVLVDEVENGIHHSVLAEVWVAIDKAAKQFNTQIFATTHSFECVSAAHESLCEDDFRLHRLEAGDDGNRCVTYDPETITAALDFNLEVR